MVNYIVWGSWGAIFLALELPAVFGLVPWNSLSRTVWNLQVHHEWLTLPLIGGLAILAVHLVRGKSVQEGDKE